MFSHNFFALIHFMKIIFVLGLLIIASCTQSETGDSYIEPAKDTAQIPAKEITYTSENEEIQTGNTTPPELIAFAETLIGIPYKYASTDPSQGFDCSGFITYIFNHFRIAVPRSSIDFTNIKREINVEEAKPGDIILFTGTDSANRNIGHMGIITSSANNEYQFIHSTSGKANSVTITPLNTYYLKRFVKVIRVFKENDNN